MKAIEQYFLALPFVVFHKVVLTFHSVNKTPLCDHSSESYCIVLSCVTVIIIMRHEVVLTFYSVDKTIV